MQEDAAIIVAGCDAASCAELATVLRGHGFAARAEAVDGLAAAVLAGDQSAAGTAGQVLVLLAADVSQAQAMMSGLDLAAWDSRPALAVVLSRGTSRERALVIGSGADECLSGDVDVMELEVRVRRLAQVAVLAADAAEQRGRLDRELEQARRIQRYILPLVPPPVPGVDIVAEYLPAAVLGGDFFDIIRLDDQRVAFFMADVVGHGVGAALNTMLIKSQLVIWARSGISVCETMSLLNDSLSRLVDLEYATAVYGVLDLSNWTLEYTLAGHPGPVLLRPGAGVSVLGVVHPAQTLKGMRMGLPLGMFENGVYFSETVDVQVDDRVLFYTDGLIEWRDEDGERLGMDGLCEVLGEISHRALEDQVAWLMHHMRRRGGGLAPDDDVNLVAFRRQG